MFEVALEQFFMHFSQSIRKERLEIKPRGAKASEITPSAHRGASMFFEPWGVMLQIMHN